MEQLKVGIVGCAGRMGRMLAQVVDDTEDCALAGGTEHEGAAALGRDLGELAGIGARGLAVGSDPAALFAACDAVIDFTTPAALPVHAGLAGDSGTIYVVGTTGLGPEHEAALAHAAAGAPVVQAANMSLGVNLLLALVEQVSAALGPDYDIEVLEMHHRHKVDAPSGTALALGRAAAAGRGVELGEVLQRVRDGVTGPRRAGDIGFATLRGGDVAGEHSVIFAGEGERLELTHKAGTREIFARGAVRAALWCSGKPAGRYTMRDVLGLAGG
ncbi:MAG: 4-hydroxy-tetrahydrodipicolinate reductase [Kiloniellales bacterium]|nr:4-hydroxy-tetrahydrodipicolinate reductase [Kiloniellales bacterium]